MKRKSLKVVVAFVWAGTYHVSNNGKLCGFITTNTNGKGWTLYNMNHNPVISGKTLRAVCTDLMSAMAL